jgi:hypothetical protein
MYKPILVDTSHVAVPKNLMELTERIAENVHNVWVQRRMAEGWIWGPTRNDEARQHPCLVPYQELPESEKEYDRDTVLETLRVILALGYRIEQNG